MNMYFFIDVFVVSNCSAKSLCVLEMASCLWAAVCSGWPVSG